MQNIIITNQKNLNETIQRMKKDGAPSLHVLSDFDRTLTKYHLNGKKIPSMIALIQEGGYLSEDYVKRSFALYGLYHPIEINTKLPRDEKSKKMHEWWKKHYELLIESRMNKDVIKDILLKNKVIFREGCIELFNLLNENKVPLIIMSAGLGDMIKEVLNFNNVNSENIHVIANMFIWNKEGRAIGVRDSIIHSLNKHEIEIKSHPAYKELLKRKNVILLGDLIEDIDMISGFPYKNLIKIGFLNENKNENLEDFKKNFDIIIINDSDIGYVNELLKEITG